MYGSSSSSNKLLPQCDRCSSLACVSQMTWSWSARSLLRRFLFAWRRWCAALRRLCCSMPLLIAPSPVFGVCVRNPSWMCMLCAEKRPCCDVCLCFMVFFIDLFQIMVLYFFLKKVLLLPRVVGCKAAAASPSHLNCAALFNQRVAEHRTLQHVWTI